MNEREIRRQYTRPLIVGVAFASLAELALLLFYGVYLSDEGELLYKVIWTLGFCGIGMGLSVGALIDLLLVGRVGRRGAILGTSLISGVVLGGACNALCMFLDRHFRYFGGAEDPILHFLPSFVSAFVGGYLAGWLLFDPRGVRWLERLGI